MARLPGVREVRMKPSLYRVREAVGARREPCQDEPGKRTRRSLTYSPRLSRLVAGERGRVIAWTGIGLNDAAGDRPGRARRADRNRLPILLTDLLTTGLDDPRPAWSKSPCEQDRSGPADSRGRL
jgi:hypothetical protein